MESKENLITILGIGNILYSDEGIGMYCLPILEKLYKFNPRVMVHYGATDGMLLLSVVEDTEYLLIVDAINATKDPGTIISLRGEEIPKYADIKMSIHQIGFSEVLAAAAFRERLPNEMVMVGMQPYSLALKPEITEEAKSKVDALIEEVIQQIATWNHEIEMRKC